MGEVGRVVEALDLDFFISKTSRRSREVSCSASTLFSSEDMRASNCSNLDTIQDTSTIIITISVSIKIVKLE